MNQTPTNSGCRNLNFFTFSFNSPFLKHVANGAFKYLAAIF